MNQMSREDVRERLGNIDQIRDIIIGAQLREYENRFSKVESDLSLLQQEMRSHLEQVKTNFTAELKGMAEVLEKKLKLLSLNTQKLQELLVGSELVELQDFATSIKQNVTKLEHQIYNSQELITLILPSITELIRLKITESKADLIEVIAPIVDEVIQSRVEQDKTSMASALAPAVPLAISQQIHIAPEEVSEAIAPTMGRAIKKQIELEFK